MSLSQSVGYPVLFAVVAAEAGGVPLPGETALITAGVAASRGTLAIGLVVALAASAAIIGDNVGYLIGRVAGRRILEAPGPFAGSRRRALDVGEPFFQRHGPKAVFFGRWVFGLRVWASWLAGATHMHWRSFLFWNALGGISWALSVGLLSYAIGRAAGEAVGIVGAVVVVAIVVGGLVRLFRARRR